MRGLRARARIRTELRSWLLWVVVLGIAAGVPLAAVAGARRTATGFDRFLDDTRAFDVIVANGTTPADYNRQFDYDELAARPDVADAALLRYHPVVIEATDGRPVRTSDLLPLSPADDRFGVELNALPPLSGALPEAEDELALTPLAADRTGADTGDVLQIRLDPDRDEATPMRVSGIVAMNGGFPPLTGGLPPLVLFSRAFGSEHAEGTTELMVFRLVRGQAGVIDFVDDLNRLGGPDQVVSGTRDELSGPVQRGLDAQADALRVFAVMVVVVAVLLTFQALRRRLATDALDDEIWRSLGLATRHLDRSRAAMGLIVAPAVAGIAVLLAVALSPLFPVGVARDVAPSGVDVDRATLAIGAVLTVAVVAVLHLTAAIWYALVDRPRRFRRRQPFVTPAVAAAGAPPTVVSGVGMAVDNGRGTRAVPLRSTILSVGTGVAAIAAVLVFAASLDQLFAEPARYGWAWDLQVGDPFSPPLDDLAAELRGDEGVEALTVGTIARVNVGDLTLDALASGFSDGVEPIVVDGAVPRGPDEALLGGRTAQRLGVGIGDEITVSRAGRQVAMRVVGLGVLPDYSGGGGLGDGMAMSFEGMRRLDPHAVNDVILVDVSDDAAGRARLEQLMIEEPANLYPPAKPADLAALERLSGLPSVLALLLAGAGLLSLGGALVSSAHRRRGQVATLKALGLVRRQVMALVGWQATTLVVLATLVGVPIGIAAGRLLWSLFVGRLGVPDEPAVPLGQLTVLVLGTLVAAAAVAVVPALLAARTRTAAALRAE